MFEADVIHGDDAVLMRRVGSQWFISEFFIDLEIVVALGPVVDSEGVEDAGFDEGGRGGSDVYSDPLSPKFLSGHDRCTTPTKRVKHYVTWVGRSFEDAL